MLSPDETLSICIKRLKANEIIGFSDDVEFFSSAMYYIRLFMEYDKHMKICADENGYRLRLNDTQEAKNDK